MSQSIAQQKSAGASIQPWRTSDVVLQNQKVTSDKTDRQTDKVTDRLAHRQTEYRTTSNVSAVTKFLSKSNTCINLSVLADRLTWQLTDRQTDRQTDWLIDWHDWINREPTQRTWLPVAVQFWTVWVANILHAGLMRSYTMSESPTPWTWLFCSEARQRWAVPSRQGLSAVCRTGVDRLGDGLGLLYTETWVRECDVLLPRHCCTSWVSCVETKHPKTQHSSQNFFLGPHTILP